MKKVLLASTALVLSAGVAAADVSVGGDGRMGVRNNGDSGDLAFTSRIRISFSASGETDAGLAFGGSIRADNASAVEIEDAAGNTPGDAGFDPNTANLVSGGGVQGAAGSVFISGSFGKITMGDVSGAAEAAVGDASGVGLTGLGDANELTYLSNGSRPAARWDYTTGDLGLHVSADNPGPAGDQAYGFAVTYSAGDFGFGLGYEDNGTASHTAARVTASLGDATLKLVYGTADDLGTADDDQYAASVDYTTGMTTLTAFLDKNFAGEDNYGVGVSYDLGGGAAIKAGFADGDSYSEGAYDFGISMSF